MSQKRKHDDVSSSQRDSDTSSKKYKPDFKSRRPNHNVQGSKRPQLEPKANATSALKSRIRDLRRLLEHVDNEPKYKMPANVRIERERELETCEHELQEKLTASREAEYRSKMIGKYHQVRFFDRQKATRILKKLKKELSSLQDASKKAELERKIHNAEVDINYAIYYPLMKPYSSLYPKSKHEQSRLAELVEEDEAPKPQHGGLLNGPKGDPDMWRTVEEATRNGTLDTLRNSKMAIPSQEPKLRRKEQEKKKLNKKQQTGGVQQTYNSTKAAAAQQDGDDSDGGFFE